MLKPSLVTSNACPIQGDFSSPKDIRWYMLIIAARALVVLVYT